MYIDTIDTYLKLRSDGDINIYIKINDIYSLKYHLVNCNYEILEEDGNMGMTKSVLVGLYDDIDQGIEYYFKYVNGLFGKRFTKVIGHLKQEILERIKTLRQVEIVVDPSSVFGDMDDPELLSLLKSFELFQNEFDTYIKNKHPEWSKFDIYLLFSENLKPTRQGSSYFINELLKAVDYIAIYGNWHVKKESLMSKFKDVDDRLGLFCLCEYGKLWQVSHAEEISAEYFTTREEALKHIKKRVLEDIEVNNSILKFLEGELNG